MSSGGSERLVVLAVDRSDQAQHAFQYYRERLHRAENRVIIVHCPQMPDSIFKHLHIGKHEERTDKINKEMETERTKWAEIQEKYEGLMKEHNITGEFVCSPCHRPGEQIIKESTDYNATMVVLGTRGLGAVRRTILGSVSDYVVHHAHCPVIVCRQ